MLLRLTNYKKDYKITAKDLLKEMLFMIFFTKEQRAIKGKSYDFSTENFGINLEDELNELSLDNKNLLAGQSEGFKRQFIETFLQKTPPK